MANVPKSLRLGRVMLIVRMVATLVVIAPQWAAATGSHPVLELETGGHMATVRELIITPDSKFLISGGDDKTIRIIDLANGQTVRILRGASGEGDHGKILAMALSPDGETLAVGGQLRRAGSGAEPIRLLDLATGAVKTLLEGHKDQVLSLAFSADGATLLSGSVDDTAILWSLADARPMLRLTGHGGDVNAAAFTREGARIVTGSDDTTLRLWDAKSGALLAEMRGHQRLVTAIAVSPADGTIASASFDSKILLWNGTTGALLGTYAANGSPPLALAFDGSGTRLIAGSGADPFDARIYSGDGAAPFAYLGHESMVTSAILSADGKLAVTAGGINNEIHVWETSTGKLRHRIAGKGRAVWAVGFDAKGRAIAWGQSNTKNTLNDQGVVEHRLRLPAAGDQLDEPRPVEDASAFSGPVTTSGDATLALRQGGAFGYLALLDVTRAGKPVLTFERNENTGYAHNAYSFASGPSAIISGGGLGNLSSFGFDGKRVAEFIGHTSDIWAVAASPDGRLLLSGSDDQTVRLWRADDGENIVTVFHGADGEWVIWTPQGYYAASPEGDKYVGWRINDGERKPARFVSAAQLKRHFYRPDIIAEALGKGSARQAVAGAKRTAFDLDQLLARRPPSFSFDGIAKSRKVAASPMPLALRFDANDEAVERIEVVVNGRTVVAEAIAASAASARSVTFDVPLSTGANEVVVSAENAVGRTTDTLTLDYAGPEDLDVGGTLHVIAVGVDAYPALKQNLTFAGADATALARILEEKAGPLHARVETTVLTSDGDAPPTARNIRRALAGLKKLGPRDTVAIFLAGHGINDGADYLFLPTDAARKGDAWVAETVIPWQELQQVLERTRGRRVMLVDTCHAGNAYNARLVKDAADASIAVLAATDGASLAQEKAELKHGVFTYALLSGLRGAADTVPDEQVRVRELAGFIGARVKELTQGAQTPVTHMGKRSDFVLGKL